MRGGECPDDHHMTSADATVEQESDQPYKMLKRVVTLTGYSPLFVRGCGWCVFYIGRIATGSKVNMSIYNLN